MYICLHWVSGIWCRWLLVALLSAQWKWPGLDWRRVHCCRQSHHLDRRRQQLHLQAARQVKLRPVSEEEQEHSPSVMLSQSHSHVLNLHLLCVSVFFSCQRASEHFRSDVGKTKEGSIPPLIYSITDRSDKQVSPLSLTVQLSVFLITHLGRKMSDVLEHN